MSDRPQPFIGGALAGTVIKEVAGAVVRTAVTRVLNRDDVPVPDNQVAATTEKVVAAIGRDLAEQNKVIVPVKSSWKSKINWTAVSGPTASALAAFLGGFGLDLSAEQILGLVFAIQTVQSVLTWIFRTFFNNTATS